MILNETYLIIREFKNHLSHIKLRSDNVLQINTLKDIEYGLDEAKEIIKNILEITKNKKYYVLVVSGEYSNVTIESMKLLSSPIAMSYAIAKAYVINSLPQKLMANFYLKFLKPEKPVRFFKNKNDAEIWLKTFKGES